MNAVVVYWEPEPGVFAEDFPKLVEVVRFVRLYGYECEVCVNQFAKRGTYYDLGIVIARAEITVKCGLYFRFAKLERGIAAAVRRVLDEKFPVARAEWKLFGLTREEASALIAGIPRPSDLFVAHQTEHLDTAVYAHSERPASVEQFNLMLYQRAAQAVYSERDESLEECALGLLLLHKKKLAVAESLTGGLLSDRIVTLPGASAAFVEGLTTYANESKSARLGVEEGTLKKSGAVSEGTAFEMCRGLLATGLADFALSTTGIAGPGGGTPQKPVGTVYIGVANADNTTVFKHCFAGTREEVRTLSASFALFYLIGKIKNKMDYSSYRVK